MKISVIVPTLNRPERVQTLLRSIAANTYQPDEIILVEQGDVEKLKLVIEKFNLIFSISVIFQSQKSTARARNNGARKAAGDIFIYLDDDMVLGEMYIQNALAFLKANPKSNAVYGSYTKSEPTWTFKRLLGVFFFVYSFSARGKVMMSGSYDYVRGKNLNKIQSVEWMPSGNMVIRAKLMQEFIFSPNFLRWSFGEDVMFTYQVHKRYPGTLYYLPQLEVFHNHAIEQKMIPDEVIRMKIIYRYIFWKKEVSTGSVFDAMAYIWSQIGLLGLDLWHRQSFHILYVALTSYLYLFRYRQGIMNSTVDFNKFIFTNSE